MLASAAHPNPASASGADRSGLGALIPWVYVQETEAVGTFRGIGVVTAVTPRAGAVTLTPEEIKGFMAAMIMMYRVKPFSLAAGLQPGDKVEFAIDAQTYTIRDLKLIERKK